MKEILDYTEEVLAHQLFELAGTPVTVATLLTVILIMAVAYALSRLVQRGLKRWLSHRVHREGTVVVVQRLTHYGIMLVAVGVGMDTLGIDLAALFAAGAIFAVAIGFAMQNIAQNFVSGVILLAEQAIKPGDVLEVDGRIVKVEDMRIRSTLGRTRDDEELIIPNASLVQSTVKNYTLRDSLYRLRAPVGVSYGSDIKAVFSALESAAREIAWRHQAKNPTVLLTEFGNSSVVFEVSVWIDDPWIAKPKLSDLNQAIWWALKDAGVTIAFPQMDLHLDRDVVEALGRVA